MKAESYCRTCKAPIRWCITAAKGRRIPLDPIPVDDGNCWVMHYEGGVPVVGVALNGDGVPAAEAHRYVAHWVTCPDSDSWRTRR